MSRAVRVSDDEYVRRYAREVRRYAARYEVERNAKGPGEEHLTAGRWAWIEPEDETRARWDRYAQEHRGLKAMNPDGTWRDWEPSGEG